MRSLRMFFVMALGLTIPCAMGCQPPASNSEVAGTDTAEARSSTSASYVIMANNDIGMHCACPSFDKFLLLPPSNTFRAQVFRKGEEPSVIANNNTITVKYSVAENTDASVKADPYYQNWIANAPKLFKGFNPVRSDGKVQGLSGALLAGDMTPNSKGGYWEAKGVPVYPVVDKTAANNIMSDPLGGPKRNPYLTGNFQVVEKATNKVLASTTATVPVAFGGCCSCHIKVATSMGFPGTAEGSFQAMGALHKRSSGIDISQIDPDGDGTPGPVRCSQCHLDPAMGETKPPGYTGYPTSNSTFSDVLHRFHVKSTAVATYDSNIATNCYACHPGNGVNCYRDTHTKKTVNGHNLWCTDCHGDLNQRVAQGQLKQPWSEATLPKCSNCHGSSYEEGVSEIGSGILGKFLNSKAHAGHKVLCSTCHGSPHALSPSNLAKDNAQNMALQNDSRAIGKCDVCHIGVSSTWKVPPHRGDD
jgi:hypothetical protein